MHQLGNIVHQAVNVHVAVVSKPLLQLGIKLLIAAAYHGKLLLRGKAEGKLFRQLADRAAADAAAHHQQMLVVGGNVQGRLFCRFVRRSVEFRPDGQSAGHQLFAGNAASDKFLHQRSVGNKIVVQVGVLHAGTARVVGGYKAGTEGDRMPLQHGSQCQCGKHVDADDIVIAAAADKLIEPLRAGGQIAIDGSALPEDGGSVLHAAVARPIQLRRVTVNADVPVADKARRPLGDELQRVNNLTGFAVDGVFGLDRLGAGVMPLAGIAA